ncbi:unnamed protein product [Oikopleura dioica]|uniref:Uncharacterized protein n=1 Tax=Oikopleura dioica TaxID=34765 RepID=E4YPM2_OIKDI|nr:unnamed protein product [Oikopleura dioica]
MRPVPPQPQATQVYPVRNAQVNDAINVMNPAFDPYAKTKLETQPTRQFVSQSPTYVELKPAYDQKTYNNIGVGSSSGITATIIQQSGSRSGSTMDGEHKASSLEWSECIPNNTEAACGPGLRTKGDNAISCKIQCKWGEKWIPLTKCSRSCGRGVVTLTKRCPVKGYCTLQNGKPPRRKSSCKVRNC